MRSPRSGPVGSVIWGRLSDLLVYGLSCGGAIANIYRSDGPGMPNKGCMARARFGFAPCIAGLCIDRPAPFIFLVPQAAWPPSAQMHSARRPVAAGRWLVQANDQLLPNAGCARLQASMIAS